MRQQHIYSTLTISFDGQQNISHTNTNTRTQTQCIMTFTKEEIDKIVDESNYELQSYQKSDCLYVGFRHIVELNRLDAAADIFLLGAEYGCVSCMVYYINAQWDMQNVHLALPWILEGAIRGNVWCMDRFIQFIYFETKPVHACALGNYWAKMVIKFSSAMYRTHLTHEYRIRIKKTRASTCFVCEETEFDEGVTLEKCGMCKYVSYCGKACQLVHWQEEIGNHISECRQLKILQEYYKPYAREFREAIIRGDDPKTMDRLQTLRTKLGLNRPKEQYKDLLLLLNNNNNNRPNPYKYLVARKDGTLHIGSTPKVM